MVRKGASYPGIGDWVALAAALLFSLVLVAAGSGFRQRAAQGLRATVLLPLRLVVSYAARPTDRDRELSRLRGELARARIDEAAGLAALQENDRLRDLLGFRQRHGSALTPALVIGRSMDRFGEVITLNRGAQEGATEGQTVVGVEGLVGVVTGTLSHECWVATVRHRAPPVSGLLAETRFVGTLRWNPQQRVLHLEGIPLHCDVEVGERILTSGHGRIFPKGIPVGQVAAVAEDSVALVKLITVRPLVDLDRMEEAFLLSREAADGLAERAWPPPAPPADSTVAGGAPAAASEG